MSFLVSFSGSSKVKLLCISEFGKVSSLLLSLVKVIVGSLNSVVRIGVFTFLHAVKASQLINLLLIALSLLLELAKFVVCVVKILCQGIAVVTLLGNIPLSCENLSLTAVDLLTSASNLVLQVVVLTILLVEKEARVVDLFAKSVESISVGVVSLVEVVVLKQLLVLQVAVLSLNGVQLVAKGQVILVTLLNLKDFCLELRDEQVFLVTREMDAVVVLQKKANLIKMSVRNLRAHLSHSDSCLRQSPLIADQ